MRQLNLYGHLDLYIPFVITHKILPLCSVVLWKIPDSTAIDFGRLAGNTEITYQFFSFCELLLL